MRAIVRSLPAVSCQVRVLPVLSVPPKDDARLVVSSDGGSASDFACGRSGRTGGSATDGPIGGGGGGGGGGGSVRNCACAADTSNSCTAATSRNARSTRLRFVAAH